MAGPADWLSYLRSGNSKLDRANIEASLDASLRRLHTDYIDIYQLLYPDRGGNYFGVSDYTHIPQKPGGPGSTAGSARAC
jgi:aryl-alcohol dehydrogenase-like predicted oxidoreductase